MRGGFPWKPEAYQLPCQWVGSRYAGAFTFRRWGDWSGSNLSNLAVKQGNRVYPVRSWESTAAELSEANFTRASGGVCRFSQNRPHSMDYGFTIISCQLLPPEAGKDKIRLRSLLEPLDLGTWLDLGPRGLRLIPHNPAQPPTYFNPDGSVDLVNQNLELDDVMSHMEHIAASLGCGLAWDWE